MKKTFTILVALLVSAVSFAYPNQSRLSVSASGNTDIRVMVDGNKYRSNNNAVMVNNLSAGYHSVKVYQLKRNAWGNPDNYSRQNRYQLVYSSNIYVKPQYHVDISINRFGKAMIDEQLMGNNYYEEEEDDWGNDDRDHNSYNRAMDTRQFGLFKQTLQNESFDNTKQALARQTVSVNYFTSAQVKELVNLFSFENSKLDMAKYAYDRTVDRENYFIVNDAFSFSSSKEQLMKYIQEKR